MSDFRELYFENKKGNGLFIKIPHYHEKENISVNKDWLQIKTKKGKSSIPLHYSEFTFIDFAYYLSVENCNKIFGSDNEYISFLHQNKIVTSANPENGRWILLFDYS